MTHDCDGCVSVFVAGDMGMSRKCFVILLVVLHICFGNCKYYVTLSHNGPVVSGANITLKAELFDIFGQSPNGTFSYSWRDNAIGEHKGKTPASNSTVAYWNVSYPQEFYPPGPYNGEVQVFKHEFIKFSIASQRVNYEITDMLNGEMELKQPHVKHAADYVSNAVPVTHTIKLTAPDYEFVSKNATSILTFWFVDCVYYGYSTNFSFKFNYTEIRNYNVEALVVVSFDEPVTTTVPPPTTTTTPTPSSNSTETTSTSTSTTTAPSNVTTHVTSIMPTGNSSAASPVATPVPVTSSISTITEIRKSSLAPNISIYGTILNNETVKLPFVCLNSSVVPRDITKLYGYFKRQITAKAPIYNVDVKGNNWLQSGELLHLQIFCNGSSTFFHCMKIKAGVYNVTGDETCASELSSDLCQMKLTHYFREPSTYTIISIIRNDVSKIVTPFVIRMYEVTKQPQLSVIVVPVTFSLVAVILIVFGVAYYVQSRNRYTVEVADFDFGQANDMEYKTFRERLREGVINVFNRSSDYSEQQPTSPPRRKYDNMDES